MGVPYPEQPGAEVDGVAEPRLTDEEWALLVRCEDLRPFIDKILDVRMRVAYDIGWVQGVSDCAHQWGPRGDDEAARNQRLVWNVMTRHREPPLYGEGS